HLEKDSRLGVLQQRLDRALANISWRTLFPEALLLHLPRTYSDHCPLLLKTTGNSLVQNLKPFRFEAMWTLEWDYEEVVKRVINYNCEELPNNLPEVQSALLEWNADRVGNIFQRKRRLLKRLEGVTRELATHPSDELWRFQQRLSMDFNQLLMMEEIFWFQKSRIQWLIQGDRCTHFFHLSTKIRRKRNKIEGLKLGDGNWCFDPIALKEAATSHFKCLFSRDENSFSSLPLLQTANGCSLSESAQRLLCLEVTEAEVWKAISSMKPLKAPGPDGFPPLFYQKHWPILKDKVIDFVKISFRDGCFSTDVAKVLLVCYFFL
ncbi:Transposon TX1 uncharacterized 149 kDa protein, partial [Linum perenne]